jgi:hypothetical protein
MQNIKVFDKTLQRIEPYLFRCISTLQANLFLFRQQPAQPTRQYLRSQKEDKQAVQLC